MSAYKSPSKWKRVIEKHKLEKFIKMCLKACERGTQLSEVRDAKGETLLHMACRADCEDMVRYLIFKKHCGPRALNRKGETPLFITVKMFLKALSRRKRIATSVPPGANIIKLLLLEDQRAAGIPNKENVSADDLLKKAEKISGMKFARSTQQGPSMPEDTWFDKIKAEAEDEYGRAWGSYEEDFLMGSTSNHETYDDWADRIIEERKKKFQKCYPEKQSEQTKKEKAPSWTEEDQRRWEMEQKLKEEHRQEKKWKSLGVLYDLQCETIQEQVTAFSMSDFPLFTQHPIEDLEKMLDFRTKTMSAEEQRRFVMNGLRLWHPDKFSRHFKAELEAGDEEFKSLILRVQEFSKLLNSRK
ncbi:unnamed protein product [Darwinula stevensoni]|uniref:NF-kappa-B inhibitor-like protein 1 n=1 Tax=Darwinula stevensoni TaxID=69355 RepID=A0A7R8X6N2_9CRUS|nr:unnamed protein product [Darwinula stevensoni]CAG0882282.1 unnamed protein product [Darwinula stevensoni]